MDSHEPKLPSSDEMVEAARRHASGQGSATASQEMVAAAQDRVRAGGTDPAEGSSPLSDVRSRESPEMELPTPIEELEWRKPREVPPVDFESRRARGVGRVARLVLVGLALAALLTPLSGLFGSLGETDSGPAVEPAETVEVRPGTLLVPVDTELGQDYSGAIIIDSSGVTLDCAGHRITGTGQGAGVTVVDANDVTITDCTIEGFEVGIVLANSERSAIEGNRVLDSQAGVVVMESSQIAVADNTISARDRGIRIANTRGSAIARNKCSGSSVGFDLFDATGNTLSENRATGNDFSAFSLTNADGNVFEQNEVDSSHFGFVLTASSDNTLDSNVVARGYGWFSFGFQEGSDGNTVTNNRVTGGGLAFTVYIGSAGNTFSDNVAEHAAKGISIASGCVGNVVEGNTITHAREVGLEDNSSGGTGNLGTDNFYRDNKCRDNAMASGPWGLCEL